MARSCKLMLETLFFGMMCSAAAFGSTSIPLDTVPDPERIERAAQTNAWQSAVASRLIEHGGADALYTAAMLLPNPIDSYIHPETDHTAELQDFAQQRMSLLDEAAGLEPQSADIASTAMYVCRALDDCNVDAYAERLHQAEPDGAAWLMPALHAAREQHDSDLVTMIVQRMDQARVFDNHYGTSVRRFHRAASSADLPSIPAMIAGDVKTWELPAEETGSLLATMRAAFNLVGDASPNYGDLAHACNPDLPEFPARQATCRHIGMLLTHASSIMDNQFGMALRRLAATGADELAAVRADTRARDWLMHAFMQTDSTTDVAAYPRAVIEYGSEAKAMAALVAAAGLPTTPPAGWTSSRELLEARQAEAHAAESEAPMVGACHDAGAPGPGT